MSKAAKMDALEALHAAVATTLKDAMEGKGDDAPSPQMLAQAIKFLKDNGVEPARDTDNSALQALADRIGKIASDGDADDIKDLLN